ncbi:MAG: hypothetical protein COA50_04125 [Flavobacteriaceae bacterium]|nr:MAG: hypothetical protein COA50_04125 [Flavobacteriaceae bacterium]
MELILNAGLGIGILLFAVLLFKQRKQGADYFFLSWILVTLLQITFYVITIYHFQLNGVLAIVCFSFPLLGSPLLFLYILSLTRNNVKPITILTHLGFYFLYVGLLIIFLKVTKTNIATFNGFLVLNPTDSLVAMYYAFPMAISGLIYSAWGLLILKQHQKAILHFFSFDEKINLKWIKHIVYSCFLLFIVASIIIFSSTSFNVFPVKLAFAFVGVALSLTLMVFGFYGFRQTSVFSNFDVKDTGNTAFFKEGKPKSNSYTKSGLTTEKGLTHAHRLTQLMEQEKPYLQDSLSLPLLAKQCTLSQTQLSQIINQHFNINFYDFINEYRIKEAKKMLLSSDFEHLTVLGIAFDCGFKSKSSFNRYFKKYCGISPSQFIKQNKK